MSLEQILRELEKGSRPGPRSRALLPDDLRQAGRPRASGAGGSRGITCRSTSRWRTARSSRPRPPSSAPTRARSARDRARAVQTLADREDRALRLVQALDDDQRKKAVFAEKAPGDIRAAATPQPPTDPAVGIAYAEMNADQRAMLRALVESYAVDMPDRGRQGLARRDRQRRQRQRPVRLGRPGRPQPGACLPRPGADLPDRVQQHPEQRQPHSLGLAEHARRLRHPAQAEVSRSSRPPILPHAVAIRISSGDIMNDWTRREFLAAAALAVAQAEAPQQAAGAGNAASRGSGAEATASRPRPAEREDRPGLHRRRRHGDRPDQHVQEVPAGRDRGGLRRLRAPPAPGPVGGRRERRRPTAIFAACSTAKTSTRS